MINNLAIPAGPETLTADWLTDALRSTGTISQARVTSFDTALISEGVGFIGRVVRVGLRYDRPEEGAPGSLVAKFPATVETAKGIGVALRFYECEIRIYQEITPDVPMRTPKLYYGNMDLETHEYILLIEDMAPARIGDQIAGCTARDAAQIVPQMAAMHAKFWEHPRLAELDWLPAYDDPCHQHAQGSYQMAWPPFLQFAGDKLPQEVRDAGQRLTEKVVQVQHQLSEPPQTIFHGDFRLDNLVFPNGGAKDIAVLDWQITSKGRGAFDLGYFLTTSMDADERRPVEADLIRAYCDALAAGGVRGYGIDECMRDYRLTVMFCWVYSVIVIGSLDVGSERGMRLFNTLLERNIAAIMDHKTYELV